MNHLYPGRKKHSKKGLPLLIQNAKEETVVSLERAVGEGNNPHCKNTLRNKHSLCKHEVISSDN